MDRSDLLPLLFQKEKERIAAYLRGKGIAEEYEKIKGDAAKDADGDGALYCKRKEPFLQKVKEYLNKDITYIILHAL